MEDFIRPHVFVALRLPSGLHKVTQLKPNTTVNIGKFGSFEANDLLGRPFYSTYEILEHSDVPGRKKLRIVPPAELYEQDETPEADLSGNQLDRIDRNGQSEGEAGKFEIVDQDGKVIMKTNKNILDNNAAQKLTMAEIAELRRAESASGRDIIARIMESHSELDKKTAFSLAKYTTRKANKYLHRFVPVPMDVPFVAKWWLYEKESAKIMDIREELLSLIGSWSNIHCTDPAATDSASAMPSGISSGRWLIVDETGGLLVAAAAEKLGILHAADPEEATEADREPKLEQNNIADSKEPNGIKTEGTAAPSAKPIPASVLAQETHMNASHNTITLVHNSGQPNLAMLQYYNYDSANSDPKHPLHQHLKTLSWLQLLHPEEDPTCEEPTLVAKEELEKWKSSKRGAYYRKRRRWERVKAVIDETQGGLFDGLIVASAMAPASIVHHLVPLLRGGAPAVIYSANVEPLAELADYYSTARKSAFLTGEVPADDLPTEDFPVNPTLLLSPTIYTARARPWQVLPGRTHPMMTSIGGPEGYIFAATRVLPVQGERVTARGSYKRRKIAIKTETPQQTNIETET